MTAQPHSAPYHQRTKGTSEVVLRDGKVQRLFMSGAAKALPLFPGPEIVFLNTAGGLTSGDTLKFTLNCDADTTATTQTAERAYRATSGPATVSVDMRVSSGHLAWLPQETILFQGSNLQRETTVELGATASCLVLEAVVLGRAAMGETVRNVALKDTRRITRQGKLLVLEPLSITNTDLTHPALLQSARAFASIVLVSEDAEAMLVSARGHLNEPGVIGAASAFDGKLQIRLMAQDGWPLRRQIARLLTTLRKSPLPRVWQI